MVFLLVDLVVLIAVITAIYIAFGAVGGGIALALFGGIFFIIVFIQAVSNYHGSPKGTIKMSPCSGQ